MPLRDCSPNELACLARSPETLDSAVVSDNMFFAMALTIETPLEFRRNFVASSESVGVLLNRPVGRT